MALLQSLEGNMQRSMWIMMKLRELLL